MPASAAPSGTGGTAAKSTGVAIDAATAAALAKVLEGMEAAAARAVNATEAAEPRSSSAAGGDSNRAKRRGIRLPAGRGTAICRTSAQSRRSGCMHCSLPERIRCTVSANVQAPGVSHPCLQIAYSAQFQGPPMVR